MNHNQKTTARISGIGGFVPDTILDNAQLEQMVDTSDLWITSRTGIKQRRIVGNDDFATSDLAAKAIANLFENTSILPDQVECVILATATPDEMLAPTAAVVCQKSGLEKAWGFDLGAACSGFLYALSVGASLIESGRHTHVIVVGADKMSSIVNYEDRNTCILFGDGAGAVLLSANYDGFGVQQSIFGSDGDGAQYLSVPAGGSKMPASQETVASKQHFVQQDGKTVFKQAVRKMGESCIELLNLAKIGNEQVDWVIPHQANLRIIKAVGEQIGIDPDKFKINIERYGNTTAATIPLALWDFKDDFKAGDNVVLTAFGAGFTWGSTYVKW
ncbi:beta-ketoacyl-ACP synthase III [Flavobacterium sp.]|uniref:beta-ketoacyl-ACP synthase III n=1 Tax=Flavobacterium sp. TaxID=239 RepID=UPI0025B894FF|nr:beta-ketoacyl-ACP synthase III [Flavobacterium sp.]